MSAELAAPSKILRGLAPHLVLIAFSASILLPLIWLLRVALTDKLTAYRIPPELAPLATAMAYAFARHNTGGSGLRLLVLASQMLPPVILVLPMYSLFLMAHLLNTWTGLLLAHLAINIPFLAWILIAFFQGDVEQLEQAARIDGATRFQAFLYVAVPVAAPGLLAAGILAFILSWNEFLFALILTGKATNTLPVGLAGFQTQRGVDIALLSAATVVTILPVLIVLPFMRRYLIKGLSLGAIK